MAKAPKYVYSFGNGKAEGKDTQRELLGGKGAGLAEMTSIGLPVPAGFTIATDCCEAFYSRDRKWPVGLERQVREALTKLEKVCGKKLGHRKDPLLVSVRSGAAKSMPGMMETVLNLGLNDESVEGLATASGNRRFALDAYRRLIMMYGSTAMDIDRERFDDAFDDLKDRYARPRLGRGEDETVLDTDVNEEELQSLINTYKALYRDATGEDFPQSPFAQLIGATNAVFNSWMSEKAVTYRRVENLVGLNGTAVNIQQMVFGNMGDDSGTGVCFTRDPSTGENTFYGDLLINAQGEDVVAGVRTPVRLIELETLMPEAYAQLEAVRAILEMHYRDMQDLEFTIERGKLFMLQCRAGKRSPGAAFRIAVEQATRPLLSKAQANVLAKKKYLPAKYAKLATKPVISIEEALRRISPADIERLFYPVIDPKMQASELDSKRLASGINAVPGAASGQIVLTSARAEELAAHGEKVVLVRKETSPEDVGGMHAAQGILTSTGGKTSHAAVVARGWGKCCIVGCGELRIDYQARTVRAGGKTLKEGDLISLDGSAGHIYEGGLPLVMPTMPDEYNTFMSWCDRHRRLNVRTNADTPADARKAIEMGAEGIGLCRTEHMFFETEERRLAMQEMILASNSDARKVALDKLLPFQRGDFQGIFEAMDGRPVTIRLIDPPLHEFLPHTTEDRERLARACNVSVDAIADRAEQLHESNPMLGHRGCRLCITYPEILDMQVTAIIEAAVACKRRGITVRPEIMIPLTIDGKELGILAQRTRDVASAILKEAGEKLGYLVGTMIETPRAALLAGRISEVADFVSFGTNDLTQTTMGLSRDDAGRFLPAYVDQDGAAIFDADPFQSLDVDGVGRLVEWAVKEGRDLKPQLKVGVCGEHGGDFDSIEFFNGVGMDYVSCSPYRVPIARLAAAVSALDASTLKLKPARRAAAKARPVKRSGKASTKKANPTRKKATKKTTRKASSKKTAARKPAATAKRKKTIARKSTAAVKRKKATAAPTRKKKSAAKKSAAKRSAAKKSQARKPAAKKTGRKARR
jgi:pyruvate,orthophosphate dikinase